VPGSPCWRRRNGVCSNYAARHADWTWLHIRGFEGGTAPFTQPAILIECAGAPQKIMYLASDYLRRQKRLDQIDVAFCLAGDALFSVPFLVPPLPCGTSISCR